jgi:hypothetical protein
MTKHQLNCDRTPVRLTKAGPAFCPAPIELRLTPNWCGVAKWNLSEIREK